MAISGGNGYTEAKELHGCMAISGGNGEENNITNK